MADFNIAIKKTLKIEGGISDNPTDRGGQTYHGISRVFHPDWEGWALVDAGKPVPRDMEAYFYKENYWDAFRLDSLRGNYAHSIAERIFDAAVNHGVSRSCKILQEALNLANQKGKKADGSPNLLWPDIAIDGVYGRKETEPALRACISQDEGSRLLLTLQAVRLAFMVGIVRSDPTQKEFMVGWAGRVIEWR